METMLPTMPALVSLALGLASAAAAAPSPVAGTLIVLNKSEATASLLHVASGRIAATVPVGEGPHEVAVSPDGRTAAVSNYGVAGREGRTLTLIDVVSATAVKTIDLGPYRRPHGIHFTPDGRRLVVTSETSQALLVVDPADGKVVAAIPTGQKVSHMVALSHDGRRAFVANIGSGSMTAFDLVKGERVRTVETGAGAEGIAVSPDGREVWVTNRAADTVSVLFTSTLEVTATLPSATFPIRVAFTPDGRRALVSNARSGEVAVFDSASRRELARIPMRSAAADTKGRLFADFGGSPAPIGILVAPGGDVAWVANANADVIAVLDLAKNEVVDVLRAGREPDGLGFSPLSARSQVPSPGER